MELLFAEVDVAAKAGKYVMYVLAVAGGFLIGNLATLIVCRLVARLLLKRKLNLQLERALRILGGLLLAALIAFLLFRFGTGWGLGGTGSGEGDQEGGPAKETDPANVKDNQTPKTVDPKKDEPAKLATGIKIVILRGSDYPKSYRFEGEAEGVDFVTAKEKLRKRLDDSTGQLKFIDIVIYRNSTAEKTALIEDFEAFAHDLGLKTGRKKIDQPLPE